MAPPRVDPRQQWCSPLGRMLKRSRTAYARSIAMRSTIVDAPMEAPQQLAGARRSSAGRAPQAVGAKPHGFSKRHQLLLFFAVAFAISYAGILLVLRFGGA